MRALVIAAATLLTANVASAQGLEFKPVDTNQFLVQPTDTATNIFSGTARYVSRAVANTIESNGFVKTLNNLLGRKPAPTQTTQFGSNLPLPGNYISTHYQNSFTPMMPINSTYGQSVVVPTRR